MDIFAWNPIQDQVGAHLIIPARKNLPKMFSTNFKLNQGELMKKLCFLTALTALTSVSQGYGPNHRFKKRHQSRGTHRCRVRKWRNLALLQQ